MLGLALRLAAIGSRLHIDDAYSWLVASQPSPHAFLAQLAATENTPPLSYLLLVPLPIEHSVWVRLPIMTAGVLLILATYLVLRRALGERTALVASLVVAVDPFLVSYSDVARGFMLEDLALVVALGAVLRLVGERDAVGAPARRQLAAFVLAGTVALYAEYSAAVFLLALAAAACLLAKPVRRQIALAVAVPFAAMAPWVPQILRAERQVGISKLHPLFATTSLPAARNAAVTLALGENGGTASAAGRWLELAGLLTLAAAAALGARGAWRSAGEGQRGAIALIALTGGLSVAGHAIAPALGIDIFSQRYLTVVVVLVAGCSAWAVVNSSWRPAAALATVLLLAVGLVNLVRRGGGEYEPDFTPVRVAALRFTPRTVITNTPVVVFYLRALHPHFDRPSNLGAGLTRTCTRPCLIIDDTRVHGGTPRAAAGAHTVIGPYILTLER